MLKVASIKMLMKPVNEALGFTLGLEVEFIAQHQESNKQEEHSSQEPSCCTSHVRSSKLLENLVGGLGGFDAQGDLVSDGDAVAFEGDDFFRMVGEDSDVFEAEVD